MLGTTAHSCTFHSEGYRWLEPTTDPHAQRLSEICAGRGTGVFSTDSGASCSGENVDDGYFHMDLSQFGVEFPFMGKCPDARLLVSGLHSSSECQQYHLRSGRSEHEVFISGNGCKLRKLHGIRSRPRLSSRGCCPQISPSPATRRATLARARTRRRRLSLPTTPSPTMRSSCTGPTWTSATAVKSISPRSPSRGSSLTPSPSPGATACQIAAGASS